MSPRIDASAPGRLQGAQQHAWRDGDDWAARSIGNHAALPGATFLVAGGLTVVSLVTIVVAVRSPAPVGPA